MKINLKVRLKGDVYIILIKLLFLKTEVSVFELIQDSHGGKVPDYKIIKASSIFDWLRWETLRPIRCVMSWLYILYCDIFKV